jgi:hypothetical protein
MIDGACPNITPEKVECAKHGFLVLVTLACLLASPWAAMSLIRDFRKWWRK